MNFIGIEGLSRTRLDDLAWIAYAAVLMLCGGEVVTDAMVLDDIIVESDSAARRIRGKSIFYIIM